MVDFSKAMIGDIATMIVFAKRLLDGHETPFSKADFVDAIQTRADATLPADWSPQRRFSRAISGGDSVASELYRACKVAPGAEVRAPVEKADDGPVHIGPAHAKMHSLAVDRQKERAIPYAAAYTEVYTRPDNAALRAAVQREHLQHAMGMMNGGADYGGVDRTLSISEAQGKEPAKDFTRTGDYGRAIARKSESAEQELESLARKYRAAHPDVKSYEIAFSKVLCDPANLAIAKRAQQERLVALGVA
jgi:hypothetical protein